MSDFKIEGGIPVARRDGEGERPPKRQKASRISLKRRSLLPIVLAATFTFGAAAIGGAIVARSGGSEDEIASEAEATQPEDVDPEGSESVAVAPDGATDGESSGAPVSAAGDSSNPDSILGHFAYAEADVADLQEVGQFEGRTEQLHASAAARFAEMRAQAQQSGLNLVVISGFRTTNVQETLFFQVGQSQSLTPQERALVSAPPGYSEHHTGYAMDIGDGTRPNTHLSVSFETTAAFRWLQANAARFGFELSFPKGNPSGVSYEPWHWRFVGDSESLATFYANRSQASAADNSSESDGQF